MRILVIGTGQLGRDLVSVLGEQHNVAGVDIPEIDITSVASINSVCDAHTPELIINAAAFTDVEGAESNRDAAFLVNDTGARLIGECSAARDIPVVHYSTDFVFDGTSAVPYAVDASPNPLSVYGASKLAGELSLAAANPNHYILRTAWLYGPGGNNFVEKIIGWATANDTVRVVTDEVGSPTHTWDLAWATSRLIETNQFGLYHIVNQGSCSRFELATAIVENLGIDVTLEPCLSSEFPSVAQRPMYSVLDCSKLEAAIGESLVSWEVALERYLQRRQG